MLHWCSDLIFLFSLSYWKEREEEGHNSTVQGIGEQILDDRRYC